MRMFVLKNAQISDSSPFSMRDGAISCLSPPKKLLRTYQYTFSQDYCYCKIL